VDIDGPDEARVGCPIDATVTLPLVPDP
jgi:hypothetical protein